MAFVVVAACAFAFSAAMHQQLEMPPASLCGFASGGDAHFSGRPSACTTSHPTTEESRDLQRDCLLMSSGAATPAMQREKALATDAGIQRCALFFFAVAGHACIPPTLTVERRRPPQCQQASSMIHALANVSRISCAFSLSGCMASSTNWSCGEGAGTTPRPIT